MIGMRLHALIFAANSGVAFAGISYDPKVDAFLKIFDLPSLNGEPEKMLQEINALLNDKERQKLVQQKAAYLRGQSAENARLALSLLKKPAFVPELPEPETKSVNENEAETGNQVQGTGKTFIGVSIVIFLAKLLGFAREIIFASVFGTNIITDIFQTIFSLPNLLFSGIGTALSAINIPNLTYYIRHSTREERDGYISRLYAQITLWGTIITIGGIIIAPTLARLLAPGIEGEAEQIATLLTRIMLPTFLFVSLTFVTTGILQVHGYFHRAAAISIPFNILIILALIWRGARYRIYQLHDNNWMAFTVHGPAPGINAGKIQVFPVGFQGKLLCKNAQTAVAGSAGKLPVAAVLDYRPYLWHSLGRRHSCCAGFWQ
jgi:hypothetical protein